MKILVINPNSTPSMTEGIGRAARAVAAADTTIVAANPQYGPASIEGHFDEIHSVPGMLEMIRAGDREGYDAYVVACFGDPGLWAAREVTAKPVVGIGEAAFHVATMLGTCFTVIGVLKRQVPVIHDMLRRYGFDHACRSVRVIGVPVLELEDPASQAAARCHEEAIAARDIDGAECLILGCAGMVDFTRRLTDAVGLPVIDGVAAAVKMAEALAGLRLGTSKAGGYQYPRQKNYAGDFARFAFTPPPTEPKSSGSKP